MEPKRWKVRRDGKCLWERELSQVVVKPKLPLLDDPSESVWLWGKGPGEPFAFPHASRLPMRPPISCTVHFC